MSNIVDGGLDIFAINLANYNPDTLMASMQAKVDSFDAAWKAFGTALDNGNLSSVTFSPGQWTASVANSGNLTITGSNLPGSPINIPTTGTGTLSGWTYTDSLGFSTTLVGAINVDYATGEPQASSLSSLFIGTPNIKLGLYGSFDFDPNALPGQQDLTGLIDTLTIKLADIQMSVEGDLGLDVNGDIVGALDTLRFTNDAGKFYEINGFSVDYAEMQAYYDLLEFFAAQQPTTGGAGGDSFIATDPGDSFSELPGGGIDTVQAFVDFVLPDHIENLILRDGMAGFGNRMDNAITGNAGNNTLDGGRGSDVLNGGSGDDTYWVDQLGDKLSEAGNAGLDEVLARVSHALANNFENLTLGDTAGNLDGTGNAQNNVLTGNNGNNTLDGGDGLDTLAGLGGDDVLLGGVGNDQLAGGLGQDLLTGGAGDDGFVFDTDPGVGGNADVVGDFAKGQDKLVFDNDIYAGLGAAGNLNAGLFVSAAGVSAQDADDHLLYDSATGQLFYDADGFGFDPALLIATLTGKPALAATDILVGE